MYIMHPKTRRKIFLDNSISDYQTRYAEVVTRVLTDDMIQYFESNAKIKSPRQIMAYENARRLLENLGTFLLLGQFKKNGIMTIYKIRQAYVKEIPASSSDSNAEDLIYGTDRTHEDFSNASLTAGTGATYNGEVKKDELNMSFQEINQKEKRQAKRTARYKNSKSYKMEKLHSTRKIRTYRLVPVMVKNEEGKEVQLKNVFGQPVFEDKYIDIGGNVGLIDETNRYQSKWCTVDTDNRFVYNNSTFEIDKSVKQYRVGKDNQCEMEKILVIPRDGKLNFFDENIEKVLDTKIKQV